MRPKTSVADHDAQKAAAPLSKTRPSCGALSAAAAASAPGGSMSGAMKSESSVMRGIACHEGHMAHARGHGHEYMYM